LKISANNAIPDTVNAVLLRLAEKQGEALSVGSP